MKLSTFLVICTAVIAFMTQSLDASEVQEATQIAKMGIDAMSKTLGLYYNEVDRDIQWAKYEQTVNELGSYRSDYSKESSQLIGDIRALLSTAIDSYSTATQSVSEWCGTANQLLAEYRGFFDQRSEDAYTQQREILIRVLNLASNKLGGAQEPLQQISTTFNNAVEKLTTLHADLSSEFDSKSSYHRYLVQQIRQVAYAGSPQTIFGLVVSPGDTEAALVPKLNRMLQVVKTFYEQLKTTVKESARVLDATNGKLGEEIRNLDAMKAQVEENNTLISPNDIDALRDNVLGSLDALIGQCDDFQTRHGQRN